jgi:hypothetical protein
MSRVSDGLMQRLREVYDDDTPRGFIWPVMTNLLLSVAQCAVTDEEVELTNQALVAMIAAADDEALEQMEIRLLVQQLEEVLEKRRAGETS